MPGPGNPCGAGPEVVAAQKPEMATLDVFEDRVDFLAGRGGVLDRLDKCLSAVTIEPAQRLRLFRILEEISKGAERGAQGFQLGFELRNLSGHCLYVVVNFKCKLNIEYRLLEGREAQSHDDGGKGAVAFFDLAGQNYVAGRMARL
ncbi:hypothetical protein GGTG_05311 [Gaeumannomyces tritici R3-111a-1]|uniref:Uncharacterized protein n=1 Tax=Gaeumannomyces tritici (strain R3-111a-1) TaxID=644352 RepID=J3NVJ6_GAET3|nr:hypothetical protein GGTG_05311 [Gaeumannomyces tritici R3-111a-1]EJT75374.1 hypothetical protein GGTG_05311 [Gaeumannomyces tritici R3-111a-1]